MTVFIWMHCYSLPHGAAWSLARRQITASNLQDGSDPAWSWSKGGMQNRLKISAQRWSAWAKVSSNAKSSPNYRPQGLPPGNLCAHVTKVLHDFKAVCEMYWASRRQVCQAGHPRILVWNLVELCCALRVAMCQEITPNNVRARSNCFPHVLEHFC